MTSICFYFQVHQPSRLRHYSVFDIGKNHYYFDDKKNKEVIEKVAGKCYLPTNALILDLIKNKNVKASYSISGTALDQFERFAPDVLESFQRLADTGNVEFLTETEHHALASLYSKKEFVEQINLHTKRIKNLFGQKPKIFRNTELIYNNEIAKLAESMGFKGILAEGWDPILEWRSPNFVYRPAGTKKIKLLS